VALHKPRPGEPWQGPDAIAHAAFIDAAEWVRSQQAAAGPVPTPGALWRPCIVQIRNDSGAARNRFDALGISGIFPEPTDNEAAFQAGPILLGDTPDTEKHRGGFGVLLAPAGIREIVPACLAGVTTARVNFSDVAHQYAEIADADAGSLASSPAGSARILWPQPAPAEGIRDAVVLLGGGSQCLQALRFELKTNLTALNPAGATAYEIDAGGERTTTEHTVYDFFFGFYGSGSTEAGMVGSGEGAGAKGWALKLPGSLRWEIIQLTC